MPPVNALADTSYLYVLFDIANAKHVEAVTVADVYRGRFVIPSVVLTEAAYLFRRAGGVPTVIKFLDALAVMQPQIEAVTLSDLNRAREIMATYSGANLDFVDCCLMALSERLGITQIFTYDRRDFGIFRPKHTPYLEILP